MNAVDNAGSLGESQVEAYWADGFLSGIEVLTEQEAASWLARLEAIEAEQRAARQGAWPERDFYPWKEPDHPMADWYGELARHPAIVEAVASILGPNVLVRNADIFIKEPGLRRQGIGWHWDTAQTLADADDFLTVWLGLTESTDDNGGLRFARGGHRLTIPDPPRDRHTLTFTPTARAALADSEVVYNDMPAGRMSIHHALMPHSSMPNRTDSRRAAFVIRFMSTRITQEMAESGIATLVRGRDDYGHFSLKEAFPVTWRPGIP